MEVEAHAVDQHVDRVRVNADLAGVRGQYFLVSLGTCPYLCSSARNVDCAASFPLLCRLNMLTRVTVIFFGPVKFVGGGGAGVRSRSPAAAGELGGLALSKAKKQTLRGFYFAYVLHPHDGLGICDRQRGRPLRCHGLHNASKDELKLHFIASRRAKLSCVCNEDR